MPSQAITFEVDVYKSGRAFNFPALQRKRLGISGGDSVHLKISDLAGNVVFNDRKALRSGSEIYGVDVAGALEPGLRIKVEASNPIVSEAKIEADSFYAQERAAGFQSNPKLRRAVEQFAMKRAKKHLCELGYGFFKNTSATECYDYTCKRDGCTYYVEVKGTQGSGASVIVTRNEVEHARHHAETIFVIVHDVVVRQEGDLFETSGGISRVLAPWIIEDEALTPLQYQWQVASS